MKKILGLLTIASMASCGVPSERVVERHVPGPEVEVDPIDYAEELAGYYQLPNGGYIELTALNDGRVRVESQQIFTANKDKGLAYHPSFSSGPHVLKADGSLRYAQNLNYSKTNNDLEQDGSTRDVVGSNRTEIIIQMQDSGYLKVQILVRKGTSLVSSIVVNRTVESLD